MLPEASEGAPVGAPVGAAPDVPPSTPTGRSSSALIPPRSLVALTGVSRPSTETLPTGASTWAPLIAPTTASVVRSLSFNFLGSRSTLICFLRAPDEVYARYAIDLLDGGDDVVFGVLGQVGEVPVFGRQRERQYGELRGRLALDLGLSGLRRQRDAVESGLEVALGLLRVLRRGRTRRARRRTPARRWTGPTRCPPPRLWRPRRAA